MENAARIDLEVIYAYMHPHLYLKQIRQAKVFYSTCTKHMHWDDLARLGWYSLSTLQQLPSIPKIRILTMEDNDVDSFNGLSKLRSSTIEELYLNGNPVTFQINYRPK